MPVPGRFPSVLWLEARAALLVVGLVREVALGQTGAAVELDAGFL